MNCLSRYHAVQEFNRGVFNYLIATDESGLEGIEKTTGVDVAGKIIGFIEKRGKNGHTPDRIDK